MEFSKKVVKRASVLASAVALTLGTPVANAIEITSVISAEELANALILPGTGLTITSSELLFGTFDDYGGGGDDYGGDDYGGGDIPLLFFAEEGLPDIPDDIGIDDFELAEQSGIYTNASGVYGLPGPGIVLSSGNVLDYEDGENFSDSNSGGPGLFATPEQNELLNEIGRAHV